MLARFGTFAALAFAACGGGNDVAPTDGGVADVGLPPSATLRDVLRAGPLTIAVVADPPGLRMRSTVTPTAGGSEVFDYTLDTAGSVTLLLGPDDDLVLSALALDVEDIVVSREALPPDGTTITNLHVAAPRPLTAPTTWSASDASASALLSGTLTFDWAIVDGTGEPIPLAQQSVDAFALTVTASRVGAAVDANVEMVRPGEILSWAGLVAISDVSVTVGGTGRP